RRNRQHRMERKGGVRIFRIQRRAITEKAPWTYLFKTLLFTVRATFRLSLLHLTRPYDVVHVHNIPDFLVFAAIVGKWFGAKIVLDIHDVVPELFQGKFGGGDRALLRRGLLAVERASCRFVHHVIVANPLWHRKLVDRAKVQNKCTTILNYPDLARFY